MNLMTQTLVQLLCTAVSVAAVTITYPKHPEPRMTLHLKWAGGVPPYTVQVLNVDLMEYYRYVGSDHSYSWSFSLNAGTKIIFQCTDDLGEVATSPVVTVLAGLRLIHPIELQYGETSHLSWFGGLAPYRIHVVSADLSRHYWKYQGSNTSTEFYNQINPGTQVVFQVTDSNNVTSTSKVVTVQQNGKSASGGILVVAPVPLSGPASTASTASQTSSTSSTSSTTMEPSSPPVDPSTTTPTTTATTTSSTTQTSTQGSTQTADPSTTTLPTSSVSTWTSTQTVDLPSTTQTSTWTSTETADLSTTTMPSTTQTTAQTSTSAIDTITTTPSFTPHTDPPPHSSLTSSVPAQVPNSQGVFGLLGCSSCTRKSCHFDDLINTGSTTYPIIVGSPVSNCRRSSDPPITTTVGGELTVGDSWSVDVTVGFNLGSLSLQSSRHWTHSVSQTFSQSSTITINAGFQGALVANVSYRQTDGKMILPSGNSLLVTSNQPMGIVNYAQIIIPCGTEFPANISNAFQCSSAGLTTKAPSYLIYMYAAAAVTALVVV